ncbi:vegetative cell wall protein gp1-like [Schistocerca piceifrons]|uniref:vegetative cell wall protein gp1-like n=1 Tax=Schistocerca piceifrons TaxID=274613 RepID=UPI001F5E79C2|nr:vegetative cell wall protein gp1-like [Schistocerca piceifrons]
MRTARPAGETRAASASRASGLRRNVWPSVVKGVRGYGAASDYISAPAPAPESAVNAPCPDVKFLPELCSARRKLLRLQLPSCSACVIAPSYAPGRRADVAAAGGGAPLVITRINGTVCPAARRRAYEPPSPAPTTSPAAPAAPPPPPPPRPPFF